MKSRKLSLLLAVIMMLSSLSVTAFAGIAEDTDVNPWTSYFANYVSGDKNSNITPKNIYDDVLGATVRQFKTDKFYSDNAAGIEPRQFLVGSNVTSYTDLGAVSYKDYDYLRISFNLFIGDTDDGLAFRMRRRNTADDAEFKQDIYFGIGGKDFGAGTVTNGYVYVNKALEARQWQNVVIELGSMKSDVKFYVNGVLSEENIMKRFENKTAIESVTALPEGTYGFGGSTNRCVMLPKSKVTNATNGDMPLDVRVGNLNMTATNVEYVPAASSFNRIVYEMADSTNMVIKVNNINRTIADAPHITGKKAIHHTFEGFQSASTPGNEDCYVGLKAQSVGMLGDVDYTKYDNLRIQFNIFLNDDSNGVYFRTRRTSDAVTWNDDNYIFNIGGAEFNGGTPGKGTAYTYSYKGLETGRWYNVVIEIGANSSNTDVVYYVDGNVVETTKSEAAQNGLSADAYGFGGASQSWATLAMLADKDDNLDLYLSDVKMVACLNKYDTLSVPKPSVGVAEGAYVGVKGNEIYVADSVTNDELVPVSATVINVVDNADPLTDWVVAYNDGTKIVKYFDVVKGKLFVGNSAVKLLEETNELKAVGDIYNFGNEDIDPCVLMAFYKINEKGQRVLIEALNVTESITYSEDGTIGKLNAIKAVPEYEYDLIKLLIWDNMGLSIKPMIRAARR